MDRRRDRVCRISSCRCLHRITWSTTTWTISACISSIYLPCVSWTWHDERIRIYRSISIDQDDAFIYAVHPTKSACARTISTRFFTASFIGTSKSARKWRCSSPIPIPVRTNERRIGHVLDLPSHLVEVIIGNLVRTEQVCAYEIERISNSHRRSSASPTPHGSNASSNANSVPTSSNHHKLVLYSLTRDICDRVYDLLRQDIVVSSIMLDKDDKRCLASDSWHGHVRDLYSISGGFRRRRVLLQVKQNQLTLVGFAQDVDAMRKQIYDYFVENARSEERRVGKEC